MRAIQTENESLPAISECHSERSEESLTIVSTDNQDKKPRCFASLNMTDCIVLLQYSIHDVQLSIAARCQTGVVRNDQKRFAAIARQI